MASLIEAIEIKRKMFFEFEDAPYHCIDVDVSKPTARGGQTLVRIKMRNLLTRAVFDKTFKAGEKFKEPDLESVDATFLYARCDGYHFMDQETFETLTLNAAMVGDDRLLLVDNVARPDSEVQRQRRSACSSRRTSSSTVTSTEPGVRGDTASGSVTKLATLETGLRDSRAALHQGRREGQGSHRDARVRGAGVKSLFAARGSLLQSRASRCDCREPGFEPASKPQQPTASSEPH